MRLPVAMAGDAREPTQKRLYEEITDIRGKLFVFR
jgi:hypothetical protein